jgi:hypothetical protein
MEAGVRAMKRAIRGIGLGIGAAAMVAATTGVWAAGTYKWVDDQGVVHYSDKAPPDVPLKGETVLDKQGREVGKVDPPLTPAQQRAKAEEEQRQKALAKAKDDQARKDRALMQSYTNEEEIEISRQRSISTIEAQIKSAQAYTADLTRQQKAIAEKKASFGSKPIPAELEHQSAAVDAELSRQAILLRQKQEELVMAGNKYDTIKQRWREIMADQERAAAAAEAAAEAKASAKGANGAAGKSGAPSTTANK